MTLHEIETFIAVFEEGSITKAALRLCMTQPGVSKTIKSIEDQYDEILFLRDKKRISPTPLARHCYVLCIRIMQQYASLETALLHKTPKSEVVIACDKGIDNPIMPGVRIAFERKYPRCKLVINEATSKDVPWLIREGKANFGILQRGGDLLGLECEVIGSDRVYCLCKHDYVTKTQGKEVFSLSDLAHEKLILTAQGTGIRAALGKLALEGSINLDPLWTCLAGDNALSFAEQGFGIAILSDTFAAKSLAEGKVRIIPTDFTITRTFLVVRRSDLWKSEEESFLIEQCKHQWNLLKEHTLEKGTQKQ